MSRRKDRERFLNRKSQDPSYQGFRGRGSSAVAPTHEATESVTCSVCQRKRNVPLDAVPEDPSTYVCLRCQPEAQ